MGVRLRHRVECSVMGQQQIHDTVVKIVEDKKQAFIIIDARTTTPQWLHLTSYAYFERLVEGTGVALVFKSTFSNGGDAFALSLLFWDFEVANDVRRLSHSTRTRTPINCHSLKKSHGGLMERLEDVYGESHAEFFKAVRSIETTNRYGVHMPTIPYLQLTGPTYPTTPFDKDAFLSMVKITVARLMEEPFAPQFYSADFKRDGRSVTMEVRVVGHRSMAEVEKTRKEWTGDAAPPIDYPTALNPTAERSYAQANGVVFNMNHKDIGTTNKIIEVVRESD